MGADPVLRDLSRPPTAPSPWCWPGRRPPRRALPPAACAPAWVHGTSMRSEPATANGRDQVSPLAGKECAADVFAQAGITDPRKQIDMVEMYVPFSWYEPMWLENLGLRPRGRGLEDDRSPAPPRWTGTCR